MLPTMVEYLKESFPKDAGNILWAIMHEPFALAYLQTEEFADSIRTKSLVLADWRLGKLAEKALWIEEQTHPDLFEKCETALTEFLKQPGDDLDSNIVIHQAPTSLAETGAWSRVLVGIVAEKGWNSFKHLTGIGTSAFASTRLPAMRTSLICMAGLLDDFEPLVNCLCSPVEDETLLQLCAFMYCSHYFDQLELFEKIQKFLLSISLSGRVVVLRYLFQYGKKEMAGELAGSLLSNLDDFSDLPTGSTAPVDEIYSLANSYYRFSLLQLTGNVQECIQLWEDITKKVDGWKAGLFLQKVQISNNWEGVADFQNLLTGLEQKGYDTQPLRKELWNFPYDKREFPITIQSARQSPFYLLKKYDEAAVSKQTSDAAGIADQIVTSLSPNLPGNSVNPEPEYITEFDYSRIVKHFIEMKDLEHAERAALVLLEKFPADIRLIHYLAEIQNTRGAKKAALGYTILESAFHDEDPVLVKRLSNSYYQNGDVKKAYIQLKNLSLKKGPLNNAEQLRLAQLAFESCDYPYVETAVSPLMQNDEWCGEALKLLGKAHLSQGAYTDAIQSLQKSVENNPYDVVRWVLLCEACRNEKENRDIDQLLNQAVEYLPDSSTIHAEIAREYFLHGKVTDAIPFLQRAVDLPVDSKEGAITAGSLMVTLGDVRAAYQYYINVLETIDYDEDITRQAAKCAMDIDDYASAEKILATLFSQSQPTADDYALLIMARLKGQSPILSDGFNVSTVELGSLDNKMDEALKLDPQHAQINQIRAEIKAFLGDYQTAYQLFLNLIEKEENGHWRTMGGLGYTSMKMGDYHTAMAALQESYQLNPEQIKLEQYLAEANLGAGLFSVGKQFSQKVVTRKPDDVPTLLWHAELYGKMDEWETAVNSLKKANTLNPDDPTIMMKLAEALVITGQKEGAAQLAGDLQAAADMDAGNLQRLACLFARLEEWDTALSLLEKSLDKGYPDLAEIHLAQAFLHQKKGDMESAFRLSQKALVILPENFFLYIYQADLLYVLGKPQAALSCIEYSDQLDPKDYQNFFNQEIFCDLQTTIQIEDWLATIQDRNGVLLRKLLFLRESNRYEDAFALAQQTYSSSVKADGLIVFLIDLAIRTGHFEFARDLINESMHIENKMIRQAIIRLSIRLGTMLDQIDEVRKLLSNDKAVPTTTSEWFCARSRFNLLEKDWSSALDNYRHARTVSMEEMNYSKNSRDKGMAGYDLLVEAMSDKAYWVLNAGTNLILWCEVLSEYAQMVKDNPLHLGIQFGYAKGLTMAGEWVHLSKELELKSHEPMIGQSATDFHEFVLSMYNNVAKKTNSIEVSRWHTRARVLFSSVPINLKDTSEQLQMPVDLEFLVGLLRRENKYVPACAIAEKLGRHFKSIWQQASCFKQSERQRGMVLVENEIKSSIAFPFPYIVLGQLAELDEDYSTAYDAFASATEIWPEEPIWQKHSAELARKCGNFDQAIVHLTKVLEIGYEKNETAFELARMHMDNSSADKAIEILEPICQLDEHDFSMVLLLGNAYYQQGETTKALEYAEQAKNLSPDSEKPVLLFARISAFLRQYHAALDYVRNALAIKPDDEEILVLLCHYLDEAGNDEESFQLLENVVVAGNASWIILGEYIKKKRVRSGPESVLNILENLYEQDNLRDDMHAFLAESYYAAGQFDKAEREALAAIKVYSEDSSMNQLLSNLNHARGQLDLAIHYAAEAIRINPADINSYLELAKIFQKRNEAAKALEVYQQAIKMMPENHLAYFHAGLLLRETRDYQEAEIMLKQAAKLVPDDLNIRRQLGAVVALNMVHNAQEEIINL